MAACPAPDNSQEQLWALRHRCVQQQHQVGGKSALDVIFSASISIIVCIDCNLTLRLRVLYHHSFLYNTQF